MYYVLSIMYQGRIKIFFFFLFFIYYILHTTYYAYAVTLSNDTYIIQTNDINLQPKASSVITPQPESKALPAPEPRQKPFSFYVSSTLVDFGEITPTDPTTRTTNIRINSGDISGFSLFALTDHELQSENKKIIPDTTCDNGSCNVKYGSSWDSILTYGFGYRYDSTTDFMQFPNQAKGHLLSPILFDKSSKERQTTITYKTNISTSQDIGLYTNTLSLIAVPDF